MKTKRTILIVLATLMLMSIMLTGCRDPQQPAQPADGFTPPIDNPPERPGTEPDDPDRPPPERNPDGTIG